nr:acetyl-CoA carboxylase carboxyltransferase subunit alpha [Tissierella sp.]
MTSILEGEKPILELETKIEELTKFSKENEVDLDHEIYILKRKVVQMKKKLYENPNSWERVNMARFQERPSTLEYIDDFIDGFIEFHGDRYFSDDAAIVGGIGMFQGIPVTIIGHQKGKNTKENIIRNFGMASPEGYRKALRLMKQAEKFSRPIITFIDTSGAFCGLGAEERGQGEAIARNLLEMSSLKTPIISIVIGEGGSGGALALGVGDRVAMLENAIYSVISPEGLSSILWKDPSQASKASEVMKLTAGDLLDLKVIDKIIKEPLGGAHKNIALTAKNVREYIAAELKELVAIDKERLLKERYKKFRDMGQFEEE